MKRTSKELKRISRDILNDRYRVPMGAFVAASIITAAIEIPFSLSMGDNPTTMQLIISLIAEFIIALIAFVLNVGIALVHFNMTRNLPYKISQIFIPLRKNTERFFGAGLLTSLIVLAAFLPLIIGSLFFYYNDISALSVGILIVTALISIAAGIYLSLTYNFVSFLLLEHSDMGVVAAFKECRLFMNGNRRQLFYLLLSFIGWWLLIACSFGIAALWVSPYMNQTLIIFYLDCTGELDNIPVRSYASREKTQ